MESKKLTAQTISTIVGNQRFQAFAVACLVLATLVFLQVNRLNSNRPMCEIFSRCKLRTNDVQKIQIALHQSGLSEFECQGNRILVPVEHQAAYLEAITEHDAIPFDIRKSDATPPSLNPFLSRSQQQAMERSNKKNDICDMVIRLPFVDQAWFEMDQSDSHSVFENARHSAVISIRTNDQVPLTGQQVDTVKRMIGGAVAGLERNEIVVIDLTSGADYQDMTDPSMTQQIRFQRVAFEQRQLFEDRIQESLKSFPGVEVTVLVDVLPNEQRDQLTLAPPAAPAAIKPTPMSTGPGANGYASIPPEPASPSPPTLMAGHQKTVIETEMFRKQISVSIDVPQALVMDLFASPNTENAQPLPLGGHRISSSQLLQRNFNQLSADLIQKVRPLLPDSAFQNRATFPIAVHLIRQTPVAEVDWTAEARTLAIQHWPSLAVVFVGLVLFSVVSRTRSHPTVGERQSPDSSPSQFASEPPAREHAAKVDSEMQLSQLIDKDPDAAAKVLESWIRDVA